MSKAPKSLSLSNTSFSLEKNNKTNARSRTSFPKTTVNDKTKTNVVDAISTMHQGSLMMTLQNITGNDAKKLEFEFVFLSNDNQNIHIRSTNCALFKIEDVVNVTVLDNETLNMIQNILNINDGISIIGLNSLMFGIDFKQNDKNGNNKQRLFFIGESPQISYIWFRGLQGLQNSSNLTMMKTLPLMVSNRLRIGHKDLHNSKSQDLMMLSIQKEYSRISEYINNLYSFASHACILDSTEHLTLLSQAMNLKQMCEEIELHLKRLNENNNNTIHNNNAIPTNDEIGKIEELYYSLHAECTVVTLKSYSMQNDMRLSRMQ